MNQLIWKPSFDGVVKLMDSSEGLIRLCAGSGPINIFEVRDLAERHDDECEDVEYNPARPNNYSDLL